MKNAPRDQRVNPERGVESYKHRFAKETLAGWLRSVASKVDDGYVSLAPVEWRVNRGGPGYGVWVEYPICVDKQNELHGFSPCWDEYGWDDSLLDVRPPTYDECIGMGLLPIAIFDVVVQHKGHPVYALEVVHRNGISTTKADYLRRICHSSGIRVMTIEADWILSQVQQPTRLKCTLVAL